jgi:hypothetical protein
LRCAASFLLVLLVAVAVAAAPKTGISPQTISLPSGPGSIEGLGESFEPQLNTGTATYAVALKLPPGCSGQTPKLGVHYNGGAGNGMLGVGWSLSGISYIQRQSDKGLPRYCDKGSEPNCDSDTFVTADGEELVLLSDGSFREENEGGFRRYRFDSTTNVWTCEYPDGTKDTLGAGRSSRIAAMVCTSDSTRPCRSSVECNGDTCIEDPRRIFRWYITASEDPDGNGIEYKYKTLAASPGAVFPDQVKYSMHTGNTLLGAHIVEFSYEDAARPDTYGDFRSGFEVVNGNRLKRIDVCTIGGTFEASTTCADVGQALAGRVRAYVFAYEDNLGHCQDTSLGRICTSGLVGASCVGAPDCVGATSRLARVAQVGADNRAILPPLSFQYTEVDLASTSTWQVVHDFPASLVGTADAAFADLNADGLPDFFETDALHRPTCHRWENLGPSADGSVQFAAPQNFRGPGQLLSEAGTQLADLDGDGVSDLITHPSAGSPQLFQIYRGDGNGSFDSIARTFPIHGFSDFLQQGFESPGVRFDDIDFDKRIDVMGMAGAAHRIWVRYNVSFR